MGHKDYCCVPGCANRREDKSGLSFYSIPLKPHDRFQSWLTAIGRGLDWIPTPHTRICSAHFVGGKKTNVPFHPAYSPTLALDLHKEGEPLTPTKKKRRKEEEAPPPAATVGPTAAWFEYYNAVMNAAQQQLTSTFNKELIMTFPQQGISIFPHGGMNPLRDDDEDNSNIEDENDSQPLPLVKYENPITVNDERKDESLRMFIDEKRQRSSDREGSDESSIITHNNKGTPTNDALFGIPNKIKCRSSTSNKRKRSAPVRIVEDEDLPSLLTNERPVLVDQKLPMNLSQEMASSPSRPADVIASSPSSGSDDNVAISMDKPPIPNGHIKYTELMAPVSSGSHRKSYNPAYISSRLLNDSPPSHSSAVPTGKTVAQLLEEKRLEEKKLKKLSEGINPAENLANTSPRNRSPASGASNKSSTPRQTTPNQAAISTIWQDTHHVTNMTKHIEKYWRDGMYNDVIINVEGESLPAHKLVLASCSSYITNLLASLPDAVLTIHLPGKKRAMKIILSFMYTGQLTLDSDTVFDVLLTASLLMMERVKLMCERFIELHQLRPPKHLNGLRIDAQERTNKDERENQSRKVKEEPKEERATEKHRDEYQCPNRVGVTECDATDGDESATAETPEPANQEPTEVDIQSMLDKMQDGNTRGDVGDFINQLLHVHDNVYDGSPSKHADFDDAALQNAAKRKVNPFAYICSICHWRFPSETYCVKHILKRHPKVHPDRISQYVISGRYIHNDVDKDTEGVNNDETPVAEKGGKNGAESDEDSVSCGVCGSTFNSIEELTDHGNKYHKGSKDAVGDRFCCSLCNEKFVMHQDCVEHITAKHPDVYSADDHVAPYFEEENGSSNHQVWTKFVCRGCQAKFPSHQLCREHCLTCPKTDARRLQRGDYIGYQCNHCEFYTPKKRYLPFHEHYKHGVPLPASISYIKCPVCGRKCMSNSDLAVHMSIHGEKVTMHRCEVCNSSFTHAAALRTHVRARHMKEFACEQCAFRTKCARKYRVHLLSHSKKASAKLTSNSKAYPCTHCSFVGPSALSLRVHIGKFHNIISFEPQETQRSDAE